MKICSNCKFNNTGSPSCGVCYSYSHHQAIETPLNVQEGGQHYKSKAIQPIVYIHANNLGFCEGNVVKYITRHKEKNGLEDLKKAKHYIDLLIELEYKNE